MRDGKPTRKGSEPRGRRNLSAVAEAIGLDSGSEFNTMQFLTEIMHTVNMFYELSNVLRDYAHDPAGANDKLVNLMDYL